MGLTNWIVNDGPRYILLIIYLAINGYLFGQTYAHYQTDMQFFYLRAILGHAVSFARASGVCLNFNCMLILLPVCRNLLSYLRGCSPCCPRTLRRQLDKNIDMHIVVAYGIVILSIIHVVAHIFNVEYFFNAHKDDGLLFTLSYSEISSNKSYININPVLADAPDPAIELFRHIAGVTGVFMTLALIFMVSSAAFVIRRSAFEAFYYTHHLFIVFMICLLIHGFGGLVRRQNNLDKHNPEVCAALYEDWDKDPKCPIPTFQHGTPVAWMWATGPIAIYILERLLRRYRAFLNVTIAKVVRHPSKVLELQMNKKDFVMKPGQYILINCPSLNWLEWHPFTLTSAPEDADFSVHIRRVGDWTEGLAKACHVDDSKFELSRKLPRICVDGPFGAPAEDFFKYDTVLLVGAGIGVTPFASILKHIWYKIHMPNYASGLRKVYLVWVCREVAMFEWFQDLLHNLESQLRTMNRVSFFEYSIYLTRGWDQNQAVNIILHDEENRDAITGLEQKTQFGRPQWDNIFKDLQTRHPNLKIGVFFCGSPEVGKILHKKSNQYTADGTKFYFNKEHF